LFEGASKDGARQHFFYYIRDDLHAVRRGPWKLALAGQQRFYKYAKEAKPVVQPELYNLDSDIGEQHDVAADHPEVVKQLQALAAAAKRDISDVDVIGKKSRAAAYDDPKRGFGVQKSKQHGRNTPSR